MKELFEPKWFTLVKKLIDYAFRKWQRTYLAGCASQGIFSNPNFDKADNEVCAIIAIQCTDALIKELDKEDK